MPHITVKLAAGRSEATKTRIAAEVTKAIMATADCPESAVSVSIEDVPSDRWNDDVYTPEIAPQWDKLYKKPGYGPRND